ncbi:FAD-dependent oxidoreductase [Arthrobacter sp. efr-133-TYG-120]|uniref:NAD(P)/FAD-dependent oxidoreductase n=1 Tax=Arthrobacter sp. efr-133-TYG-120 TaxID=3040280 RepID=UPI00254B26EB|nr:FAD-dependent oxidoreductase [Arthrobacter sp. efr-133-TYG-120]
MGGQAGVQAADSLRSGGFPGSITIVADEATLPYQRPPLSKDYLVPTGHLAALPLRPASFYTDHGIDLLTGVAASTIDRHAQTVTLADGTSLPYDYLLMATGSRNRSLSCPGADLAGIHSLKTITDAERLQRALSAAEDVVVIGAGFIGLEFASAAKAYGCEVTVLEFASRPMSRALSPVMSDWFSVAHERNGVRLRLNEGLSHFERDNNGHVCAAHSMTGARYTADLVVVGVGVIPNDEVAAQAGLETNNGILVDEALRTSDPRIFAIGDCASFPNSLTGSRIRLESVQNAAAHGRHAAQVILHAADNYEETPWFWSTQGSLRLPMAGIQAAGDTATVIGNPETAKFSVLCHRVGRLVAVESVNAAGDHIAARKLLTAGLGPSPEEAQAPGFSLKAHAQQASLDPA